MNAYSSTALKAKTDATVPATDAQAVNRSTLRLPNDRWKALEIVFWLLPVASYFFFPDYLVLISQIMIIGLFAMSLDLILGYAGIVSLGHAAFFGLGAYTAGLLSVHGWGEPISGLLAAAIVAGKYYVPQVGAFVIYTLMVVLLILFPFGLVRRKA